MFGFVSNRSARESRPTCAGAPALHAGALRLSEARDEFLSLTFFVVLVGATFLV